MHFGMRPSVLELVASIRWTFGEHIAPTLEDALTQSYGRGIVSALTTIETRLRNEGQVLVEQIEDLRSLLRSQQGRAPTDVAALIEAALGDDGLPARYLDVDRATDEANTLSGALVALIAALPTEGRDEIRSFLTRQLAREERLLPVLTGPAF